jgi:HSP20 family protein
MGLIDKVTELLPWRSERREPSLRRGERRDAARGDVLSLRDELDRWLQRLLEEPAGTPAPDEPGWIPSVNVHETDDEMVVRVEVPGLDPADLDLMVTPGGLIVRGEKREMREERPPGVRVTPEGLIVRGDRRGSKDDRRREVYIAECRYGSFVRTVPLPPGIDLDRAEARVANGVLIVRFPKVGTRPGMRRIPIDT